MQLYLRIFLIVVSLVFLFFVLRLLRHERFTVKYALLWVVLGILGVVLALFPAGAIWFANVFGFEVAANFVFVVMIVLLMAISLIYGGALSKQDRQIKMLVEEVSLLKAQLNGTDQEQNTSNHADSES